MKPVAPAAGVFAALVAALLLTAAPVLAQGTVGEVPPAVSASAGVVLQAGIEALGGHQTVLSARRVAFSQEGMSFNPGQARHSGEAAAEVGRELHYSVDADRQRVRLESSSLFPGGIRFHSLLVLEPEGGFTVDLLGWRQGTDITRHDRQVAAANLPAVERVLPHLLLQQALAQDSTLSDRGEAMHEGAAQRVISYRDASGTEVVLHFDAHTHRLSQYAITRGALLTEVRFQDYRPVAGLQIPHRTLTYRNGEPGEEVRLTRIELNPPLAEDLFALPAGYSDPPAPGAPRAAAVGRGAYRLENLSAEYRSMFVEMDDLLVVFEAPQSPAFTQAALQLIRQTVPEKPIRYVLVTHHHGDHIAGLATFVAEGATLIVGSGTEEVIRAQLARQGIESPEAVAIETVAARRTLGTGDRRIEIYSVPNSHADGSLMFYLPAERLLFQGDLFYLPERGPVPAAFEISEDLARAIRRHDLQVEKIVGVHGRPATLQDLQEALAKRAAAARH